MEGGQSSGRMVTAQCKQARSHRPNGEETREALGVPPEGRGKGLLPSWSDSIWGKQQGAPRGLPTPLVSVSGPMALGGRAGGVLAGRQLEGAANTGHAPPTLHLVKWTAQIGSGPTLRRSRPWGLRQRRVRRRGVSWASRTGLSRAPSGGQRYPSSSAGSAPPAASCESTAPRPSPHPPGLR